MVRLKHLFCFVYCAWQPNCGCYNPLHPFLHVFDCDLLPIRSMKAPREVVREFGDGDTVVNGTPMTCKSVAGASGDRGSTVLDQRGVAVDLIIQHQKEARPNGQHTQLRYRLSSHVAERSSLSNCRKVPSKGTSWAANINTQTASMLAGQLYAFAV